MKCRDCGFIDNSQWGVDKCPDCKSDDWIDMHDKVKKKKPKKKASKKFIVTMEFEDERLAGEFGAYWLDGGGEQGFLCYDEDGEKCFYTRTEWDHNVDLIKTFKVFRTEDEAD